MAYNSNYINEMNKDAPEGTESKSFGDDAIREIKRVLQTVFPKLDNGVPLNVTSAEVNTLAGNTLNIAEALSTIESAFATTNTRLSVLETESTKQKTTLYAPSGTVMLFLQAAAPAGWNISVLDNDRMLRVVNSAGNAVGGFMSPTGFYDGHSHTINNHTLTQAELPSHAHTVGTVTGGPVVGGGGYTLTVPTTGSNIITSSVGSNAGHSHTMQETTLIFAPRYIDAIRCVKV
jgi:hypothetical protein